MGLGLVKVILCHKFVGTHGEVYNVTEEKKGGEFIEGSVVIMLAVLMVSLTNLCHKISECQATCPVVSNLSETLWVSLISPERISL